MSDTRATAGGMAMAMATTWPGRAVRALGAPLAWLERAKGRRRWALVAAYLLAAGAVGLAAWWATSLDGLPDPGDPFDVAAYRASARVDEADDAHGPYRRAIARMERSPVASQDRGGMWAAVRGGWSAAAPHFRAWAEANREALGLWREGAARPAAGPREGGLEGLVRLQELAQLGLLEGSRREESGDLAGAWDWYAAVLRCSRHLASHAPLTDRGAGAMLVELASPRVRSWADRPGIDAERLRRALADLVEVERLSPPASETLKADYLEAMERVEDPDPRFPADVGLRALLATQPSLVRPVLFLRREPERSRRVVRLIYAHLLAHADDPPSRRPKLSEDRSQGGWTYPDFPYYRPPGPADAAHPLSNEAMYGWHLSTLLAAGLAFPSTLELRGIDGERATRDGLRVALAERLYRIERGEEAPSVGALVEGGYLESVPGSYAGGGGD